MWAEYRFWRNRTKHIIDKSKQKYYNDMIKDSKDSKTLWKCLHSLNPSNPSKPHELITTGDHKTTDHKEIANTFNNYFTSCVIRYNRDSEVEEDVYKENYVTYEIKGKRHVFKSTHVLDIFDRKTTGGSIGNQIMSILRKKDFAIV
ncbi:Hypothetical predicted protein [Mytilus galloprovincialis]|uniref:Uncharacterized protein n=1 Tax=Mytilus galloprovincialis TaxID=29158 RepID=A0A8B6H7G4_MYTGA|nr:Hypothetical predicted protein [Mytilus galloprovincialis]